MLFATCQHPVDAGRPTALRHSYQHRTADTVSADVDELLSSHGIAAKSHKKHTQVKACLCSVIVDYTQGTCGQLLGDAVPQPLDDVLRVIHEDFCKVPGERRVLTPPVVCRLQKSSSLAKPLLTVCILNGASRIVHMVPLLDQAIFRIIHGA